MNVTVGSLVRRKPDISLSHLHEVVLKERYPPPGSVCVVLSKPRKRDLSCQRYPASREKYVISLTSAIDIMHENRIYKNCELSAFENA